MLPWDTEVRNYTVSASAPVMCHIISRNAFSRLYARSRDGLERLQRQAHNLRNIGSNPIPATNRAETKLPVDGGGSVVLYFAPVCQRGRKKGTRKRMKTNLELLRAQLQLDELLLDGVCQGFER